MPATPRAVIVLFGGTSSERRVSVASAQHLAAVVPEARFWFWAPDDSVVEVPAPVIAEHARPFETDFVPLFSPPQGGRRWGSLQASLEDVQGAPLLLALHGGSGEDGTLQRALEARGIPFTGSGSAASELAMDKARAKERVGAAGVRVSRGVTLLVGADLEARLVAAFETEGPQVVKPRASGSSVGLSFIRSRQDCAAAAARAIPGEELLVERFVSGREITVGILETPDGVVRALPCSEVRMAAGRDFDFEGKYLGQGSEELTPARLPEDVFRACQDVVVRCHRALGCRGYSRTDLILEEAGPVFLETNTLPGLTRASFIPQQLAAAGIPIADFLRGQIELALLRAQAHAE
jgi:D-alanine-D-alanine ligase